MLLDKTFLDTNVLQRCKVGTQSILINLRLAFQGRKTFRHRYQWAVNWNKLLPVARVLPKPSKSFTKARPIIACDRCWHSRLTIFLARALYQVMMTCFPTNSTFNIDSTLLAMRRMWFMMQNAEEPTNLVQQDAGPYRIFQLGATRQDLDVSEVRVVTVVGEQRFTLGTADFAGHLTSERQVLQDLSGFQEVCQPTNQDPLDSGPSRVGRVPSGFQLRHTRVACLPPNSRRSYLCTMVANTTEFITLKHFRESLRSSGLLSGFRYADNRAFLLSTLNQGNDWRRLLLNLEFYGLPILLENVPGEELLGTTCSTQQGAITVR